jgi:hypothetical protein
MIREQQAQCADECPTKVGHDKHCIMRLINAFLKVANNGLVAFSWHTQTTRRSFPEGVFDGYAARFRMVGSLPAVIQQAPHHVLR